MNVYIISTEDNLPSVFTSETVAVYDSSKKAKDHIGTDYHDMIKECDNGSFMPRYFKEYTTEATDGYWEIRSKLDPDIYMSEYVEEFELE